MKNIDLIDRRLFPELNLILWDQKERFISEQDAYAAYEKRWRYVDARKLEAGEQQLIAKLTAKIGHGMFLAA